jgi:hypothetical protein
MAGTDAETANREVKRTCSNCGTRFHGASHARYCSGACKQAAYRDRKRRGHDAQNHDAKLRTCVRCGGQFSGALYGRYCTAACKQAQYRERKTRKTVTL